MKQEDFNNLKKQIEADTEISEDNVHLKSLEISKLQRKYLDIYIKEFAILKKIKVDLDNIFSKRYKYFNEEHPRKLDSTKEIEYYIKGEDDYYKKSLEFEMQDFIVKYLEKTLDIVKNMSFNIKNYYEIKKFFSGC